MLSKTGSPLVPKEQQEVLRSRNAREMRTVQDSIGPLIEGSFRDPAGSILQCDSRILRQVNSPYWDIFDQLESSGLFEELVESKLLHPFRRVSSTENKSSGSSFLLEHPVIPFISYSHEWCFSQLKEAALLTLEIMERALKKGFILKDASSRNVQFVGTTPVFIDTLSFERYVEGDPWRGYRQFIENFLCPLALMSLNSDFPSSCLHAVGGALPIKFTSRALPLRTVANFGLLSHIHLHAWAERTFHNEHSQSSNKVTLVGLRGILDNLKKCIDQLRPNLKTRTQWQGYESECHYTERDRQSKITFVRNVLENLKPKTCWDIGANTGFFSRLAADYTTYTVSFEKEARCVEDSFSRGSKQKTLLPLVLDIANPSAGGGWRNREMKNLFDRGCAEVVLALALVHHLSLVESIPLREVALLFSSLTSFALVEFVPELDPQVKSLRLNKGGEFHEYTLDSFTAAFLNHFEIESVEILPDSGRQIFLFKKRM